MKKVTEVGQIKKGDRVFVEAKDDKLTETAIVDLVIDEGSSGEEILLHRDNNIYFIMSMYLDGSSWAKNVFIVGG